MSTIDRRAAAIAAASAMHEAAHEAAEAECRAAIEKRDHACAEANRAFRAAIDEINTEYPVGGNHAV